MKPTAYQKRGGWGECFISHPIYPLYCAYGQQITEKCRTSFKFSVHDTWISYSMLSIHRRGSAHRFVSIVCSSPATGNLCSRGLKLKLFRETNQDLKSNPKAAVWLPEGRIMTLTQQWRYLNLTRNSFYILLPAKGIVSYRQIISSHLYVRLKSNLFTR